MRRVLLCCLLLAGLSLLLPSQPSYDPWAWLVWGRELSGLSLDTFAGPSWKPLPPLITAVYAKLPGAEALAPGLWLVTVRAAGLAALALAGRLAWRLAGGGRRGALAGAAAASALLASPEYVRYLAHGNEVPLAAAFVLGAVLAHLERRRSLALCLGALAALLRPEAFPFLAAYGVVTWRREPRTWPLVAGLVLLVPALWLVPEWIGSGDPLGGGRQARSAPSWSLAADPHPWLAALSRAQRMAGLPLELAAVAALAAAIARRERVVPALAGTAIGLTAVVVAMTQAGFSGNPRYLALVVVVVCVLAGIGVAEVAARARRSFPAVVAATLLAALAVPFAAERAWRLGDQVRSAGELDRMHAGLASAVQGVGGPAAVRKRGQTTTNRVFQTHLAWVLRVPMDQIERPPAPASMFVASGPQAGPPSASASRVPAPVTSAWQRPGWRVVVARGRIDAAVALQRGKPRREPAAWPLRIR